MKYFKHFGRKMLFSKQKICLQRTEDSALSSNNFKFQQNIHQWRGSEDSLSDSLCFFIPRVENVSHTKRAIIGTDFAG